MELALSRRPSVAIDQLLSGMLVPMMEGQDHPERYRGTMEVRGQGNRTPES